MVVTLNEWRSGREPSPPGADSYLVTIQRLTSSLNRLTAISEHLDHENKQLKAQAGRRSIDDWFAYAIRDLATRQITAYQDSVIRVDDNSAAHRRGQAAAMGERMRSFIIGADTCADGRDRLLVWITQERVDWEQRAGEIVGLSDDSDQRQPHTRAGWVSEVALHLQALTELENLVLGGVPTAR